MRQRSWQHQREQDEELAAPTRKERKSQCERDRQGEAGSGPTVRGSGKSGTLEVKKIGLTGELRRHEPTLPLFNMWGN